MPVVRWEPWGRRAPARLLFGFLRLGAGLELGAPRATSKRVPPPADDSLARTAKPRRRLLGAGAEDEQFLSAAAGLPLLPRRSTAPADLPNGGAGAPRARRRSPASAAAEAGPLPAAAERTARPAATPTARLAATPREAAQPAGPAGRSSAVRGPPAVRAPAPPRAPSIPSRPNLHDRGAGRSDAAARPAPADPSTDPDPG